ncbi:4a-hydroxytetrahydrobiopterin dehydratase [Nocardia stercoris]|uniref:Putative pterin-4-alpha-carbinolamine dehydratase n=1 Tax=Nocardia stercoris TaxID=2483361 RepID=A0A3M2LEI2_9NOCA|nr:4a-hydroxytetrahydrobiopterin dehydratase [Nocardia stercoris]RMI34993.1 4a-hydroxytetrahydrobiopterin dehydratase [Nocardia stercoris]
MTALLAGDELDEALAEIPEWTFAHGTEITRTFTAPTFLDGIELVRRVAVAAEEANHHPDIDIRWRKVTFTLSTHEAGGLTRRDVALARQIDDLFG